MQAESDPSSNPRLVWSGLSLSGSTKVTHQINSSFVKGHLSKRYSLYLAQKRSELSEFDTRLCCHWLSCVATLDLDFILSVLVGRTLVVFIQLIPRHGACQLGR